MKKEISFSGHNYSFDKEGDKIKLSLGNMTDAGWFWDGDKNDLADYFIRLKNSKVRDEFIADANKNGLKLSDVKAQLIKDIQKGDGVYTISGDNRLWRFGEGDEPDFDSAYDDIDRTPEEKEKIEDEFYNQYETSFDEFEKIYGKDIRRELLNAVNSSKDFEELFSEIEERESGIQESFVREYRGNQELEAFGRAVAKVSPDNKKPSSDDKNQKKVTEFSPSVGMSLNPPSRSTARRSTGRGSRRGSV